jgi:hypothetical protein
MSDQTTEQTTEQTVATEEVANTASTSLQLSDILLCAQVVQLASQRGAFRAEEFTQVGQLYDRLVAFLKESGALQKQEPAADTSAELPAE